MASLYIRSSHRRLFFLMMLLPSRSMLLPYSTFFLSCYMHPLHSMFLLLFVHTRCPLLHHCPPGSPLHHCTHPLRPVERTMASLYIRSSHRRRHFRLSVLVYPLLLLSGCG